MFKILFAIFALVVLTNAYEDEYYPHEMEEAPLGHDGEVIDTPEVYYAKAEHERIYNDAVERLHDYGYGGHHGYRSDNIVPAERTAHEGHGNFYNVYGDFELVDGKYLPDSKDVHDAKVEHFAAVHDATDH